MKVMWIGGPIDGCVDDIERPTLTWIGPDISVPTERVVVYVLHTHAGHPNECEYRFDRVLTNKANEHLRDLRLE